MNEFKTISDSKKEFHLCFPFVIAPIYRRITDELLVELHLLKHQKSFIANNLFAVGLTKVFDDFMQGYRPEEHKTKLFEALCKCNGFDSNQIKKDSQKTLNEVNNQTLDGIEKYLKDNTEEDVKNIFYSRLSVIGVRTLVRTSKDNASISSEDLDKKTKFICEKLGFTVSRVDKDLSVYNSNLGKINQALELLREGVEREKRKKAKSN